MSNWVPKRKKEGDGSPSAALLLEQAVHLLRTASAAELCWYYLGTIPWVLGLIYFWAHTTWFAPSPERLAWSSLLLVLLFAWLKTCQSIFCARLYARRLGVPFAPVRAAELPGFALRQVRLHAVGLLAIPMASVLTVPIGYVWTYYQTLTALDSPERKEAPTVWNITCLWPMQTHLGMLVTSLLFLVVWINLILCFFILPELANSLLGLDNVFGMSGWTFMNSTFQCTSLAVAWLAIDPLVKTYHVLRAFYGVAIRGGEDLREVFTVQNKLKRVAALVVLLGGLAWGGSSSLEAKLSSGTAVTTPAEKPLERVPPVAVLAQDGVHGSALGGADAAARPQAESKRVILSDKQVVRSPALKRSLDETLKDGDYDWRLKIKRVEGTTEEGPVVRFFKSGVGLLREMVRSIERGYQRIKEWWRHTFGSDEDAESDKPQESAAASTSGLWLDLLIYVFYGLLVLLIAYLAWVIYRQARKNAVKRVLARPVSLEAPVPDLNDEKVHAAQLPSDGWLALAREKLALGEWRLAFRALYLAQLASFSEKGFLSLAQYKTNSDYESELRRRQPHRTEILDTFGRRRRGFDAIWYGRELPEEREMRHWLEELGREGGER